MDCNEFNVNEGAFWHTNMDLYYGYQPGEVVEVEHESNKYWLAYIEYTYKHLMLLRWVGGYGEFWIDTSFQSSATNSSNTFSQSNTPKRLFPLGHHLQYQLRCQFILEKPTKVLVEPSLYDPTNDPYAGIETIDDLLAHELVNDTFVGTSSLASAEPASIVMAKCKTKIAYGQEDVDELEAALQNLNEIDPDPGQTCNESPCNPDSTASNNLKEETSMEQKTCDTKSQSIVNSEISPSQPEPTKESQNERPPGGEVLNGSNDIGLKPKKDDELSPQTQEDDENYLKLCKILQEGAINEGKYNGLGKYSGKTFHMKPKQFFDTGGANQEKVLVPGAILEVCHTIDTEAGFKLYHWFAVILKNVGGRLTLQWFLCDEPKFKQGRLELKSNKCKFVDDDAIGDSVEEIKENNDEPAVTNASVPNGASSNSKIPAKETTFIMHFCNPCIHTIGSAKAMERSYKMPQNIVSHIEETKGTNEYVSIQQTHIIHVYDSRRMSLDRDRPIIDHLLSTVRLMTPHYVNIKFGPTDAHCPGEVLLTSPKMTKVFRGLIKRQLDTGVFEIHSEPLGESGEIVKFVYPYDSSYTILPRNWEKYHEDCLVQLNCAATSSGRLTPASPASEGSHPSQGQSQQINEDVSTNCVAKQEPSQPTETESGSSSLEIRTVEDKAIVEPPPENQVKVEPLPEHQEIVGPNTKEDDQSDLLLELETEFAEAVSAKFKVMQQLEVVHPSSDTTICSGRIRKVAYPLLWIQISSDSFTVLPFNSTEIYPSNWSETHSHPLISLLPPRKRINHSSQQEKKRKKVKILDDYNEMDPPNIGHTLGDYEVEKLELETMPDRPTSGYPLFSDSDSLMKIYFNHKCFTGPSLSKGKICSLPQYVGPGPLRLVIEEVITKVISVAYVPPRILNDLSSKSFRDLLIARNMTNTALMEFKAKYQKRVHRELVPVCLSSDDVARYCECVCEHLKCCYNLFGPNLYDGDDCPGHCRALTKSNKFMKRATYYREKARLGEFLNNDNGTSKKSSNSATNGGNKSSRARYAGRGSSESTSSATSRSEQVNSRASSAGDEGQTNDLKENLAAVEERENEDLESDDSRRGVAAANDVGDRQKRIKNEDMNHQSDGKKYGVALDWYRDRVAEYKLVGSPEDWTVKDVGEHLRWSGLACFRNLMISEGIDGQALLLLDKAAIKEYFRQKPKVDHTQEQVGKLWRFVEYVRNQYAPESQEC